MKKTFGSPNSEEVKDEPRLTVSNYRQKRNILVVEQPVLTKNSNMLEISKKTKEASFTSPQPVKSKMSIREAIAFK